MNFNYTNSNEFNNEDVEYKKVEISRHEWEHDNEMEISELWRSMNNYLEHNNLYMLDKCTYTIFSEFVSLHTTPPPKYEEEPKM